MKALADKKENEKRTLESEAKNAAEAEVKRLDAQKKLKDVEDKINLQNKQRLEQENKVHELELKAKAEGLSLITESKALEAKAHELEKMKQSNMEIENKIKEDGKIAAELELKRKSEDKTIAENEARLAWEKKAIQDGELLLKSQLKAAAEAEDSKET